MKVIFFLVNGILYITGFLVLSWAIYITLTRDKSKDDIPTPGKLETSAKVLIKCILDGFNKKKE